MNDLLQLLNINEQHNLFNIRVFIDKKTFYFYNCVTRPGIFSKLENKDLA